MFDLYSEALLNFGRTVSHLPKDMALMKVYDYYDNEESYTNIEIVIHLFNGLDYDFNDEDEDITSTVIKFSTTTYAKEYFKLFNLCNNRQKTKLNKLSKPLFTIELVDNTYYTENKLLINPKLHNKDVIKVLIQLREETAKAHQEYLEKLSKKKK